MFKTIHYTLCGLEYVYLVNAPIGVDEGEEYIDLPPEQIDKMIATEIIRQGIPLRGREVLFLRKALKMNCNQWAEKLDVTASGILRWEQGGDKRLSKINEVAIRMLCAEELGVELEGKWSAVVAGSHVPERLEVAA
jgi:DNA-binding transcriptional regulator YiaG